MPWCPECGAEYREGFTLCSECRVALVAALPARPPEPSDAGDEPIAGGDWLTAGVFTTGEEARLARGFLDAQGISAAVVDAGTHEEGFGVGVVGELLLKVAAGELGRAKQLLTDAERGRAALADDANPPGDADREGTP